MKLQELYQSCRFAMVEVSLPLWPHTVLYMDSMYDELKGDYTWPAHHVEAFRRGVSMNKQPTDVGTTGASLYDKVYQKNVPTA